ncbi:MAG TPA: tetraacyldisaccharide 4'-kinase [Xanthobacteraceae bacterium]|nr:tetraacyldisaccharide 4'-kinase [Xanthobacteraceae bacterium]
MRSPRFWWRKPGLGSTLLAPLAAIYGGIAGRRLAQAGADAGIPVICVGNPTVGGAGKTPTAIALARLLLAAGEKPAFLSRGYGGRLAGPVRVAPAHRAAEVGDEPLLLARLAPTIVARDRVAGASLARDSGASVIVMDDGFQNPSLAKDFSILVIDGARGLGNGRVFPAGPLRAPLPAQLARASAILVIDSGPDVPGWPAAPALPVFHGTLEPDAASVASLRARPALAFAGIGDPEKFFITLDRAGVETRLRRGFGDHHRYDSGDAANLVAEADRHGVALVTTEKDLARLRADPAVAALAARAQALPVALRIAEADELRRAILAACRQRSYLNVKPA